MPKRRESIVNRVVRHLAEARGSGILGDVSRRLGLCGILARTLETDATLRSFVAAEERRSKTTHRPITRLTLTPLGAAYAQAIKPGYRPARLPLADWQAQLAEMTAERTPVAMQIARALALAAEHDAREAARKVAERAQQKAAAERARKPKVKRGQSEWFKQKVLNEGPELFADECTARDTGNLNEPVYRISSSKPIGTPPTTSQPMQPRQSQQTNLLPRPLGSPKEVCAYCNGRPEEAPFHDCRDYQSPVRYGNVPTPAGVVPDKSIGRERERIRVIIRERGYGDALLPNGKVLFDNREIWPEDWAKEHGPT